MRQIFTLFACLISFLSTVYAQDPANRKIPGLEILKKSLPVTTPISETVIRIRCMATTLNDKPLLVIDGIIAEEFDLKNINPNDIESICILKNGEATALFGCMAASGVIVIITRTANQRTITVKDFSSGEPLPAATVELIYGRQKKDTIRLPADSLGRVKIDRRVPGKENQLRVSNVGYKTYSSSISATMIGKKYSVALQRNYLETTGTIVVRSTVCWRRCGIIRCTKEQKSSCQLIKDSVVSCSGKTTHLFDFRNNIRLYPNPVMSSQKINIEFEGKQGKVTVKLFSLDYRLINAKEYEAVNGINKMSFFIKSQLSSGMYIIQLFDEMNYLVKAERLIIQ